MKGFFLIDKKSGMTSFDVVRAVRRQFGVKKVGHAGTLDPLATGLLLVGVGEGTKMLEYFVGLDKEYEVLARFGAVSDTYDAEGRIGEADSLVNFKRGDIEKVTKAFFLGRISQIPPKYSALKIAGKRAADWVRSGKDVEMKAREVEISDFEILNFKWPSVKFRVKCSSGTYIRSLIHDLGQRLGCGAYVEELKRTKIGNFDFSDAVEIEDLNKKSAQWIDKHLISLEKMAEKFAIYELTDDEFSLLSYGQKLKSKKNVQDEAAVAVYKGKVVGILEKYGNGKIKFRKRIF